MCDEKKREDYLINWMNSLWFSIREKENNCWKFLTFYIAALAIIPSFGVQHLPLIVVIIAILILTSAGMIVIIDSNFWFNRNLHIIANIERFIAPYIYKQKLLPQNYDEPRFTYSLPYRTLIRVLTVIFLATIIWFILDENTFKTGKTTGSWLLIFVFTTVLCVWGFFEDLKRRSEYAEVSGSATADRTIEVSNEEYLKGKIKEVNEYFLSSPVSQWLLSSIQLISVGIILDLSYPESKAPKIYYILLFWFFLNLFFNSIITSGIKKFFRKGLSRVLTDLTFGFIVIITGLLWIYALALLIF